LRQGAIPIQATAGLGVIWISKAHSIRVMNEGVMWIALRSLAPQMPQLVPRSDLMFYALRVCQVAVKTLDKWICVPLDLNYSSSL